MSTSSVKIGLDADDIFDALRKRHPAYEPGFAGVGRWVTLREWQGVDLLALDAWRPAQVIGYEVKVSRSDMRSELLKPAKRAAAVAACTQFYFAVPAGMLTDEERAWAEPEWEPGDFERQRCGGIEPFGPVDTHRWDVRQGYQAYGGKCEGNLRRRGKQTGPFTIKVPIPTTLSSQLRFVTPGTLTQDQIEYRLFRQAQDELEVKGAARIPCPACSGKGYAAKSKAESLGPTLWVPRDVGLVVVGSAGTATVLKHAPKREVTEPIMPYPFAPGTNARVTPEVSSRLQRQAINTLVRWVSARPDPRHQER